MMRINTSGTSLGRYRILRAVIAVTLCLCGVQATSWANQSGTAASPGIQAEAAEAAEASKGSPAPRAPSATQSIDQTYAAREASAKGLEEFKGGDVVIIGSTGLIIVLLIIMILIIA